jgi:hypothetical protein
MVQNSEVGATKGMGRGRILYVCARLREGVPYGKVYRYNPKHVCPKLNGYGDNGQRSFETLTAVTNLLITKYTKTGRNMWFL